MNRMIHLTLSLATAVGIGWTIGHSSNTAAAATPAPQVSPSSPVQAGTEPIEIVSSSIVHRGEEPRLSFTMKNRSDKKIVAYCLVLEYFDRNGKAIGRGTKNAVWGLGSKLTRSGLEAGETLTDSKGTFVPTHVDDKTPASHKITIDYVLFADRNSWGPDTMKQSLKIAGILEGFAVSRAQLKTVLERDGADAVANTLRQ